MSGFFEEVQRRKVYRVAAAYVIAAGFIIQIGSAVFPAWELPNWALRLVIALLLIGFPIALILAWAFDVTPEGIKVTPESSAVSHRRRNVAVLGAAGVIVSAAAGFFLLPPAVAHKVDKSIAVLPFENLSDEKENAFFADGIQDDILTNLSKIGDLKVISRTSVMGYRGKGPNVREIGKALGVSTILEGSVRREGNRVRLNVQLINANNDEHIWANNYDRDLTDVFAIQTDLAREVADALQAKLSPNEKAQLSHKPTENGEAYVAFVQAHELNVGYEDREKLNKAEKLYETAIQLDPKFALAFARLSQLESWIVHSFDPAPARREKARALAQRALELQPDLPEAHLAMGFSHYYGDSDYAAALNEFLIAQRGLPNESEGFLALGAIQRRQGRWGESTANLVKASSLNPKDGWILQNLAINYEMTRDFASANRTLDRALEIDPKLFGIWEIKAKVALEEKGDFSVAEKALAILQSAATSPDLHAKLSIGRVTLLVLQRKFAEAAHEAESIPDAVIAGSPEGLCSKYSLIGVIRKAVHDEAGARQALLKARSFAEQRVKDDPSNAGAHSQLAEALACLGEKDAAIAEGMRAMEMLPESKDAFEGPTITESLASVYTIVGDKDRAIELLDGLLARPSTVTVPMLRINPVWDPLRADSRFQALLDKYAVKA